MKSRIAMVLPLILIGTLLTTDVGSAAQPKPGAKCAILKQTQIAGDLKFTCIKSGSKLVWSKGVKVQNSQKSNAGNNNNSSGNNNFGSNNSNGPVTLGSACPKKGDTGPIPNGTAICASSNGKLTWISVGSQPVPSDGVWIYFGGNTQNWNTDLPPDGWTGEPEWFQSSWDIPTTTPLAPKCSSNTILTNFITDIDGLQSITPQGFMQPGSHALPVPHMYYNTGSTTALDANGVAYRSKVVDLYAPADMTIYSAAKLNYTMANGYQYSEWMLTAHFCGTYWMFNAHIGSLSAEVQAAIDAAPVKNCQKGGQLNTSSQDCYSSRFAIKVKAGTLYAKSSGRAHGFDFGFTDASKPIPTRINPSVFAPRWAAGLCHIKYYSAAMQSKIESKLVGNNDCGQLVSDVAGTAQGVWLASDSNKYSVLEDYHIALAKHWSDKNLMVFSIGWNADVPGTGGGIFTFKPNANGPNNKPFSSVKNGDVACYDNLTSQSRNGESLSSIYIKMTAGDTEKLSIAPASGSCGAGPYQMPQNSQTFQRKVK